MKLISAMAFATVWAGSAHAVNPDDYDSPYVGGAYLHEFGDGSRDSDQGQGFRAHVGVPLEKYGYPRWAAELGVHSLGRERDIDGNDDYQIGIMLDLVYDFGLYGWDPSENFTPPRFKPFVLAGLGAVQDDVRGSEHEHFGFNVGGGLLIPTTWRGLAARFEARALGQVNDESVPDEDLLIDYQLLLGLQMPLEWEKAAPAPDVEPIEECELAVVDPVTGRSDCGTDSDRDGVLDGLDQCPATPEGATVNSRGCPVDLGSDDDGDGVPNDVDQCPSTQAGAQVDTVGCVISQSLVLRGVNFEHDSAILTGQATMILDEAAASLRNQANVRVEIGGHTDSVGNDAYNLALSQQRAESVRQYLINRGVAPERLVATGYGEFEPVDSNETQAGRAANRRVEFELIVE